jgi:hypothetical protein
MMLSMNGKGIRTLNMYKNIHNSNTSLLREVDIKRSKARVSNGDKTRQRRVYQISIGISVSFILRRAGCLC